MYWPDRQKIHDRYLDRAYCLLLITGRTQVYAGERKIIPVQGMKAYGRMEIQFHPFLTSVPNEVWAG